MRLDPEFDEAANVANPLDDAAFGAYPPVEPPFADDVQVSSSVQGAAMISASSVSEPQSLGGGQRSMSAKGAARMLEPPAKASQFHEAAGVTDPQNTAASNHDPLVEPFFADDGHPGASVQVTAVASMQSVSEALHLSDGQSEVSEKWSATMREPSAEVPHGLIAEIMQLGWQRGFAVKSRIRNELAAMALIRRMLGWEIAEDDKAREKANKEARKIWRGLVKDGELGDLPQSAEGLLGTFAAMVGDMQKQEAIILKSLEKLGQQLPGAHFVDGVKGFSHKGHALLVAEAGALGGYTRDALRKRLGLAPYRGAALSNWRKGVDGEKLTKEEWCAVGYSPRTRSVVFAYIEEPLFRQQWRAEQGPIGPYGQAYLAARLKAKAQHEDWSDGHLHLHSRRVMVQRLVNDIRKAWRVAPSFCEEAQQ